MLLQELCKYYERIPLEERVPLFYTTRPVRYLIRLDKKGKLRTPQPIDTAQSDSESKKGRSGKEHPVPDTNRSANTKPLLIADKPEYVLGPQKDASKKPETKNEEKNPMRATCISSGNATRKQNSTLSMPFSNSSRTETRETAWISPTISTKKQLSHSS